MSQSKFDLALQVTGAFNQTALKVKSATDFALSLKPNESLTADRVLNLIVNDANRTINLAGDLAIAGAFSIAGAFATTLTVTAATALTLPTTGTLSTLAGTETLSAKTLASPAFSGTVSTNIALGANSITGSGSLGTTGTRFAAGFFTDLTVTNNIAGSITGNSATSTLASLASLATALVTPRAIYGNNFDGSAALTQIIASIYGGTGNGFTKFTGPATAEKTFTLPNSSATLLYAGGALGTPASGTLTSCTGLPISTGVSGLAAGIATFLGASSSANLLAALTDKTGTGLAAFATSPAFTTSITTGSTSFDLLNTTATTVNAFGGASVVNMCANGGTLAVKGQMEIGRVDGTASTPFIDFHAGATVTDYDARFIVTAPNGLTGGGTLTVASGSFVVNAQLSALGNSNFSGHVKSSSPTGGVGYVTGAGGSVTQITSKSTTVQINAMCGVITTHAAELAGGASVNFAVINSSIGPNDTVEVITRAGAGSAYSASVFGLNPPFNSFIIKLTNEGGTSSDAVVINFTIIRGASA